MLEAGKERKERGVKPDDMFKALITIVSNMPNGKVGISKELLDNFPKKLKLQIVEHEKHFEIKVPTLKKRGIIQPSKKLILTKGN